MSTMENARLGVRLEIRKTAEETNGELFEFDVVGRAARLPRAVPRPHRADRALRGHRGHDEARDRGPRAPARAGRDDEVPAGARTARSRATSGRRPRPRPGPPRGRHAGLPRARRRDAPATSTASASPSRSRGARLVARLRPRWATPRSRRCASSRRSRARDRAPPGSRPYVFVDEWDVAAPPRGGLRRDRRRAHLPGVVAARSTSTSTPTGRRARQGVAPALQGPPALPPAHALARSCALERAAHVIEAEVDGDLRGRGNWTLTPTGGGTHVRFDWQVHADRRLLRSSRRCCARRCAGTTRGRSRARSRASSPTPAPTVEWAFPQRSARDRRSPITARRRPRPLEIPGADRRAGRRARRHRAPRPSVHAGARRSGSAAQAAHPARRRAARRREPPARLPLPPALPEALRALRSRRPAAFRRRRARPRGRLPAPEALALRRSDLLFVPPLAHRLGGEPIPWSAPA